MAALRRMRPRDHAPRELAVGGSTINVIWGNKLAPGLGDLYLGHTGVESQLTNRKTDPNRPDNLFDPVEADFEARGKFSDRSRASSTQLWARTHPLLLSAGVLAAAAFVGYAVKSAPPALTPPDRPGLRSGLAPISCET
jgi:hypothetical protein